MKKLSSCVLVLSLCLSQCGSICSADGVAKRQESLVEQKISLQGKNGNFARDLDKQANKSKKENKKHSKGTNINVDLTIPSIVLGATVLGVTGVHEYVKYMELKKPGVLERLYNVGKRSIVDMYSFGKESIEDMYNVAVDSMAGTFIVIKKLASSVLPNKVELSAEEKRQLESFSDSKKAIDIINTVVAVTIGLNLNKVILIPSLFFGAAAFDKK